MKVLENKIAIVTGASRGIGKAIAACFAANGAKLVIVSLHPENLEIARVELSRNAGELMSIAGDVADPEFAQRVVSETKDRFGSPDVLVNCAGIITRAPMSELSLEDWRRVIDVNLNGAFYMMRAVLPGMVEKNAGKIINITSQMARLPHPGASPNYEVSKAGLTALTRHAAYHYAKYGICVNAIAPGSIDTDLPKSMSEEARQKIKNGIPMRRLGDPEEVGALAVFLASDKSDYITGSTLDINGGSLMN